MNYIYIILSLFVLLLAVISWKLYKDKKESEREAELAEKERDEYVELGKGMAEYNQKLQEKKDKAKEKILTMFGAKVKVGSYEVTKALNISSASTRRYFDELEAEGKVKQTGKSGKKVYYSRV